jgi:AraC family cel operon transcriptional repressor
MQKGGNFIKGAASMTELSGKTYEHICREMKRHLNQTPTSFINNLRLNYAANLIANTDMPVIQISLESGFNNLSHFNHLFKQKFGLTPSAFRNSAFNKILY